MVACYARAKCSVENPGVTRGLRLRRVARLTRTIGTGSGRHDGDAYYAPK